ncbi:hypothetical protein WA158_004856 [Blastocystis sp. Blastoise]
MRQPRVKHTNPKIKNTKVKVKATKIPVPKKKVKKTMTSESRPHANKSWKPLNESTRIFSISSARKAIPIALKAIPSSKLEEMNNVYDDILEKTNEELQKIDAPPTHFNDKTIPYKDLPLFYNKLKAYLFLLQYNENKLDISKKREKQVIQNLQEQLHVINEEKKQITANNKLLPLIVQDLPDDSDDINIINDKNNIWRQKPITGKDPFLLEYKSELSSFRKLVTDLINQQSEEDQSIYNSIHQILSIKHQLGI